MGLTAHRFRRIAVIVALVGTMVTSQASAGVVRIGVVQSTTGGSAALYGIEQKNAAELAVEEINASRTLGDLTLELIHLDDGADRGQTINIYQRLINRDNVSAIFGPSLSTSAFAADPIAQKAGVPVIKASNTASGITAIGSYIFRLSPPEERVTPGVISEIVSRFHVRKAAQIYTLDDQLSKSAYNVQKKALADNHVSIVAAETFQKGDVDFSAQLTKIKAAAPDLVVIGALAEESAGIIREARQLGIPREVVFVAPQSAISSKYFELAGAAADGLIVGTAWYADLPDPKSRAFVDKYVARYGHRPDVFSATGYDAIWLLAEAIRRAGSGDRKAIRDALAKIRDYPGVLGPIGFDDDREPVIVPKIMTASEGRFIQLQ